MTGQPRRPVWSRRPARPETKEDYDRAVEEVLAAAAEAEQRRRGFVYLPPGWEDERRELYGRVYRGEETEDER